MGRLATDVGGTFTDLVFLHPATGRLETAKSLTTPKDLTNGISNAVHQSGLEPRDVEAFIHGGTTVINTITERKGARTALVTTKGFRDVIEIQRGNRPDLYNLRFKKELPFVPRRLRYEMDERVAANGQVLQPLREDALADLVSWCREHVIEAVAILYLHSYASPDHERKTATYLRTHLPDLAVTASCEITREWREYERANTAILNAYVQPVVRGYLADLQGTLEQVGIGCPYAAMQSNGGTTSFDAARHQPITMMESGPAAGCNGAAVIGAICQETNIIYLDVGGTTAKCTTITDAKPVVTTDYRLEYSRTQFGYPLRIPVVDIVEIGAGGGSVAWLDDAQLLRVGPVSAGSEPGPACYGRGGTEPTVTDAKLVTGVINPNYFAGGDIQLNRSLAEQAIAKVAGPLGLSIDEAAIAIIRTADADMINALKLVSIQRGHDPRDFALVVGGGGGAMHGAQLGRELGVKKTIIPQYPGLFSAWGMLATEPRRDFQQTQLSRSSHVSAKEIDEVFRSLKDQANDHFSRDCQTSGAPLAFEYAIDMRYAGQEHTVRVDVPDDTIALDAILAAFHERHEAAYTFRLDGVPVEFVTYRLVAYARVPKVSLEPIEADGLSLKAAQVGTRMVDFGDDGGRNSSVYRRSSLPPDCAILGPAIIEEPTSTTLICPGQVAEVDALGLIHIREA